MATITELQARAYQNAVNKGWYDGAERINIPEKLCLVHSEVSEALEEYRNGKAASQVYFKGVDEEGNEAHLNYLLDGDIPSTLGKPEGFSIELADAVIRILDLCGALGIDLEKAVETKMAYNATRPHRHGGKAC